MNKVKNIGLRLGTTIAAAAIAFGTVPSIAAADEITTPSTGDSTETGFQEAETQWMTTTEENFVDAVPSAPVEEAAESSEAPAPSSDASALPSIAEPELDGDVSFDLLEERDSSFVYEMNAKVNLPVEFDGEITKPDEISFLRTPGENPAENVEEVQLGDETVADDKVALFSYPSDDSDVELPSNFPDDVTGDLLSIDLKDYDAEESVEVKAEVVLPKETDINDTWSLYTGDASAQELNAAVRAVNGQSEFRAVRRNDANVTRLVVQVGGDRILNGRDNNASRTRGRSNTVYKNTGHSGAQLALYAPLHNGKFGNNEANSEFKASENPQPINQPWARCTSDSRGECVFEVPKSGPDTHPYYWVAMTKASPGFEVLTSLRAGGSGATDEKGEQYRYAFATPYMQAGNTYFSGVHYKRARIGNREFGSDWQFGGETSSFMYEYPTPYGALGKKLDRSSLGVFQQVRKNPPLSNRCGLNVGFIIDTSGSMGREGIRTINTILTGGEVDGQQVEGVIPALAKTKTKMGFVSFDNTSPGSKGWFGTNQNIVQPRDISQEGERTAATNWVGRLSSGGATNWEAGLRQFAEYNQNARERYDVVFMITDGNPTNLETRTKGQDGSYGEFRHAEAATAMANTLKSQGTRVVPVGIPAQWPFHFSGTASRELDVSDSNLAAISGQNASGRSDSLREKNFITFRNANVFRQALINTLNTCEITVERRLYTGDDLNAVPSPENTEPTKKESRDWGFDTRLQPRGGKQTAESKNPKEREGSDNLVANFNLNGSTSYSSIEVREKTGKVPSNWSRMLAKGGQHAQCFDERGNNVPVKNLASRDRTSPTNDFQLENVPALGGIHCVVYYRLQPQGDLMVHKVDADSPDTRLEGAEFKLEKLDNDDNASEMANPTVEKSTFTWKDLPLGRYKLTEMKPPKGDYAKLDSPIFFGIQAGNDGTLEFYRYSDEKDKNGKKLTADSKDIEFPIAGVATKEKAVELSVANTSSRKPPALPDTGGAGITLLVIAGLGISGLGVGMSLRNSRRSPMRI